MANEDAGPPAEELESRTPTEADLAALCRNLNKQGAKYVVVGGFAMIHAGHARTTMDVDLLIATDADNESRVFRALESLPDKAVLQLSPGETAKYRVVRIADEIVVDLMRLACDIDYHEASKHIIIREVEGVAIPFASPQLLWRMKKSTHRAKDEGDLFFLAQWFQERGEAPPP
jgi:hypothetical protein